MMKTKGIYTDSTTDASVIREANSSTSYKETWTGSHILIGGFRITDGKLDVYQWNFGSGDKVKPNSTSTLMLIKY